MNDKKILLLYITLIAVNNVRILLGHNTDSPVANRPEAKNPVISLFYTGHLWWGESSV